MQTSSITAAAPASPAAGTALARAKANWGAIAILGLTIFNASTMRTVFSPVQEAAKLDLHVSDFQLSLVQGVAASIPVALLAIPLGRMIDKGNRVLLLIAVSLVWTVGTIATAFAFDFDTLFLTRMLAGLGAMCSVPIAISLAADFCPPELRGRGVAPLNLGVTFGGAAAFVLGGVLYGMLAAKGGFHFTRMAAWRELHLICGVASGFVTLALLFLREPVRHELGEGGGTVAFGPAMAELWRRRAFLLPLFVGQIGVVLADVAASIWAAPVLTRSFHQTPQQFGAWFGGVLLASGVLGAVVGGLGADLGHRLKMRGGILLGAVIVSGLCIPAALFPIMPTIPVFAWALFVLIGGGAVAGLITATALALLIPNEIRGLCLTAFVVIATIIGFGVGPTLVALVSSLLGGESHLDMALALTGAAVGVLSFLGFLVAMLKAPRDAAG